MPPSRDTNSKQAYNRSNSSSGVSLSAKVYHNATNLMPTSPTISPTNKAPTFPPSYNSYGRQNSSSSSKYS